MVQEANWLFGSRRKRERGEHCYALYINPWCRQLFDAMCTIAGAN